VAGEGVPNAIPLRKKLGRFDLANDLPLLLVISSLRLRLTNCVLLGWLANRMAWGTLCEGDDYLVCLY